MPVDLASRIGKMNSLKPAEGKLHMFDNQVLPVMGMITCKLHYSPTNKVCDVNFYVTANHKEPLLGLEECLKFELIKVSPELLHHLNHEYNQDDYLTYESITRDYADLFTGFGKFPGEVTLETDPNVPPVRIPPRRLPLHLREKVERELKTLCDNDILVPVTEPTDWASPLMTTLKPNGDIRIVMDPQSLNTALKPVHCLMNHLDVILPELNKAKVFSHVDLKHAFWHCVLDKKSQLLCCMNTPFGRLAWKRLPMGLSVSSQIYALKMAEIVESLHGVKAIADDLLVYGRGDTLDEARADHDRALRALLDKCREYGIKLNKSKLKVNCQSNLWATF